MNKDTVMNDWKQLSGKIRQKWSRLTDMDLMRAESDMDYLLGKLREYYGLARDKAEQGLKELGYQVSDLGYSASRTNRDSKQATSPGHSSSSRTGH
jgi:uncharacterized protein YjbJ (UPF0337 family)